MCDHCLIESVKQRMPSRRNLINSTPATALASRATIMVGAPKGRGASVDPSGLVALS